MKKESIILGVFFSIFIINYTVRQIIGSAVGISKYYNILLLIFVIIMLRNKEFEKDKKRLIIISIISFIICFSNFINRLSIGYYLNPLFNFIIPMILLSCSSVIVSDKIFKNILKYINVLMYVVTILGVIDYISGYKLNYLLQNFIFNNGLKELMQIMSSYGTYRLFNALGHPLVNVEYYLIYFFMNWAGSKYLNLNVNMLKVVFVYIIGIFLCGSKMALFLSIIIIFIYSARSRNKYLSLTILCFTIAISISFVNTNTFKVNIGNRLVRAIQSGDITNGRIGAIKTVFNVSDDRPNLLVGKGYGYSTLVTEKVKTNNFEFPPLMMAYDYGIITTVTIYLLCFIFPIIQLFKEKQIMLLGAIIILIVYFNSFNGLVYGDSFARLVFTIKILCDISKQKNSKGVIKNGK